jgi:hypothetical protein
VYLWETATGKERRRFPIEELQPEEVKPFVDALGLSPDGSRLFAMSRSGGENRCQINVWDTATGKRLTRRPFEGDGLARFTPNGKGITLRTREGLTIQDTLTGKELVTIPGVVDMLPTAFSPDGKLVAVARRGAVSSAAGKGGDTLQATSEITAVGVAELATGRELRRIETGAAHRLAFSADGRMLAASDGRTGYPLFLTRQASDFVVFLSRQLARLRKKIDETAILLAILCRGPTIHR